jgi:membrane-associated HD superfamily phosphohydrolase
VATDKSNAIVELGPYFIPIYAIIITVVYFVIASSYNINGSTFVFLIGFALAFHIISTIEVMKIRQPDIVKSGYFFSIILVYVLNIIVMSLIFAMIFPSFQMKKFFVELWGASRGIYAAVFRQLFRA